MAKISRRAERELAFIVIFEQTVTGEVIADIIENARDSRDVELSVFVNSLVCGVDNHKEEIDEVISSNAKGWSLSRMSKVSLALLRIAVYELMFEDSIPVSVSINEAVELAKLYGGKDDPAYVNGVLSSVAKSDKVCEKK